MKPHIVFMLVGGILLLSGCLTSPVSSPGYYEDSGGPAGVPTHTQPPPEDLPCEKGSCYDIRLWYAGGVCMVTQCTCTGCEKYWDCWNAWTGETCEPSISGCESQYGSEYIAGSNEYVYIKDPSITTQEECEG